ncbi:cytochrome P450 [Litorivivens sp.]|uniref:cytochrome P450 n=1 Tax=Litorivivens sp. TaxID=2020868 RepID=UPI003568D6DF
MSTAKAMSPAVEKPAHIPDELVFDFDYYADPGLLAKGHDRALEIVKEAPPIFWTPRNDGHWMLMGHKAVFEGSKATDLFSNSPIPWEDLQAILNDLPEDQKPLIPSPITLDPPLHTALRLPLQKAFSPKAMKAIETDIRKLASDLVASVKDKGGCEFMSTLAEPLPVTVFLKMFGLPTERQGEYRALVKEHLASTDFDPGAVQARLRKVANIMRDTILERKENPQDDVLSMLWATEIDGKPMTMHQIESYGVMIFVAGLDTVMNGMGLGAIHLAKNPEFQNSLRADPSKVAPGNEEMLRRYTFTLPVRFLTQDTEFQGAPMKKGEKVILMLPGADLDPSVYAEPATFNTQRESVHIAFGVGPHRCLGSHLARIEMNVLYEEMLKGLPEFRLDPSKPVQYHGGPVWGPEQVHLVW